MQDFVLGSLTILAWLGLISLIAKDGMSLKERALWATLFCAQLGAVIWTYG